ncbi:MAG TPA: RNB domain-containing ribonuclease [Candidatus Dormibacteraeota bacterium]|nr:RNB domain-containing ribonuclease [Candidatus Dormibacteraeota bacterium]
MTTTPVDLKARARAAMLERGFHPDFPAAVTGELAALNSHPPAIDSGIRDLRGLLWSSIDNDTSRDLDQVEYAEKLPNGGTRLLVGIADVDAFVSKGSSIDGHASSETTSVYTGVATFPMLPGELSNNATSLLDAQERLSVIIEMIVLDSGETKCQEVYLARLKNAAKLTYSVTGAWFEGRGPIPRAVANVPGMEAQLRLQQEASEKLRGIRKAHGALAFESREATPVLEDGTVKDLKPGAHNAASDLIESFMVAANVTMAQFLKSKGSLSIRRVVKTPKRWDRIQAIAEQFGVQLPAVPEPRALSNFLEQRKAADPVHFPELSLSVFKLLGPGEYIVETPGAEHEGHFGLALNDYTHSTAPNRRFTDLLTQRLLKAVLKSAPCPYSQADLSELAKHCTEREDAARKVERLMRKVCAASLLSQRIGEIFEGIVTGASAKGTYVRLLKFPAEGRVVRGERGIDVGDKVQVRLAAVDVPRGFIDFERQGVK